MMNKSISYVKRRWRQISGAIAVLLMFLIPATRAVLASNDHPSPGHHHHYGDSDNCSKPTNSTPKAVSPVNPSSTSHSNSSKGGYR